MVTLYYTQYFMKGFLKGLTHNDTMNFVSSEAAGEWLKRRLKPTKRLNYFIIDYSFQCYFR